MSSIQPNLLHGLTDSAKTVYLTLVRYASNSRFCRLSLKNLVEHSGYGKTTVVKGVQLLEAREIIKVNRIVLPPPKGQGINEYEIVWWPEPSQDINL